MVSVVIGLSRIVLWESVEHLELCSGSRRRAAASFRLWMRLPKGVSMSVFGENMFDGSKFAQLSTSVCEGQAVSLAWHSYFTRALIFDDR